MNYISLPDLHEINKTTRIYVFITRLLFVKHMSMTFRAWYDKSEMIILGGINMEYNS